jgi:hypothetical protein
MYADRRRAHRPLRSLPSFSSIVPIGSLPAEAHADPLRCLCAITVPTEGRPVTGRRGMRGITGQYHATQGRVRNSSVLKPISQSESFEHSFIPFSFQPSSVVWRFCLGDRHLSVISIFALVVGVRVQYANSLHSWHSCLFE